MKQYQSIVLLHFFILSLGQSLFGQDAKPLHSMSLEQIWNIADINNRVLKLSNLQLRQTQLEVLEAKDRLLPELSIGGSAKVNSKFLLYEHGLFSSSRSVPVKGYGYGAGYDLNFKLYDGGQDRSYIQLKQEEKSRKEYEVDLQKHNVKYQIALAYFDLYKFLHFRDFLLAEITTEKKQLSVIESLHSNGMVLKSDVLRISVKLSQLELNLSDIGKKVDILQERLNLLMGRDNDEPLAIPYQDDLDPVTNSLSDHADYLAVALDQSPVYKMATSAIKRSEISIKQIKGSLLPQLSLYSTYQYTYPQVSFYPYSNDLWGFGQTGIKIQYAIDRLYKGKHSLARAGVTSEQAKETASIKRDELTIQVKEAYLQQQQASERIETANKNISKTSETVRVIRNSYLHQESLLTDLLEAENALLEAKFDLISAQTSQQISHIQLLAIIGVL